MKTMTFSEEQIQAFKAQGFWNEVSFEQHWAENAERFPDKEALVDARTRLTWRQANDLADHYAAGFLALGIPRDSIVVLQLQNCVEVPILRVACERAGLISFHVPPGFREAEMEYFLKKTGASTYICPGYFHKFNYIEMINRLHSNLPQLQTIISTQLSSTEENVLSLFELEERGRAFGPFDVRQTRVPVDEACFALASSGSTGLPKIALHTTQAQKMVGRVTAERAGIQVNDVTMAVATVAGGAAIAAAVYTPAMVGCKAVFLEEWSAQAALEWIEKEHVTVIGAVPTQLLMMAAEPELAKYDTSSLRIALYAGAPLAPEGAEQVEAKLGCKVISYYGSIENHYMAMASHTDSNEVRHKSTGKLYPGFEARLVDDAEQEVPAGEIGELQVRGPFMGAGLLNDEEQTRAVWASGGWYRTGDLAMFDNENNIHIVGRKKDVINRGGQKIIPGEIEGLLLRHPKVASAAVMGFADPVMGERACAFVVTKGGQPFSMEEMQYFLAEQGIAKYKFPEKLIVLSEFPLLPGGKLNRAALRKELEVLLERAE